MADRRIRIPKDKSDIIKRLVRGESSDGPFRTKADLMTFAASLGFSKNNKIPFSDTQDDPIRQDVFNRQGYDTIINLVALADSKNPQVLMKTDEAENEKITIFEEYANGGLSILRNEIQGTPNPISQILLLINQEREQQDKDGETNEFDLTRFL